MSASVVDERALAWLARRSPGAQNVAEVLEATERRLTDEWRKTFGHLRGIEGPAIRARLARIAEREAERFLGFGHSAEDADQYKLKSEDLAAQVDFELLRGFSSLRHLTVSDLNGVSAEDWCVKHFVAVWMAEYRRCMEIPA